MAKEIKGEDGKTYVVKQKKPWYKRWWVWVIVAVVAIGIIGAMSSGDGGDSSDSSSSDTASSKANSNHLRLDGEDIYYTNSKKYKVKDNADTSWPNATAKVNSVTIYKVEKGYTYGTKRGKKAIQGMLAINVTVKALKDIQVLMNIATVSIPSINEQHEVETKEDWDDIDQGISKTGTVYIPIYKLNNVKDVKEVRFKFDCQSNSDNDDDDIDNYDHTYNINLDLE